MNTESLLVEAHHGYLLQPNEFRDYLLAIFSILDAQKSNQFPASVKFQVELPRELAKFEHVVSTGFEDGFEFYVIFVGKVFGVATSSRIATQATEFVPYGYRVKARSQEHAHAMWWLWIHILEDSYRKDPTRSIAQIISDSKVLIPSKKELKRLWYDTIDTDVDEGVDEGDADTAVGSDDALHQNTEHESQSQAHQTEGDALSTDSRLAGAMESLMVDDSNAEEREGDLEWELSRQFFGHVDRDLRSGLQDTNEYVGDWIAAQPSDPEDLEEPEEWRLNDDDDDIVM